MTDILANLVLNPYYYLLAARYSPINRLDDDSEFILTIISVEGG
jgi:hypothetical protein